MGRAPCCDKTNVKRGPWSPEEDATLRSYLERHGTGGNWIALPHKAGLRRCGKSCRLRWLNYLRPDIKHGCFTQQEDNIICTLYNTIGSRWSVIASHLPGRTDNDVKNYWNTKLKKKLLLHAQQQPTTTTTTTTTTQESSAPTTTRKPPNPDPAVQQPPAPALLPARPVIPKEVKAEAGLYTPNILFSGATATMGMGMEFSSSYDELILSELIPPPSSFPIIMQSMILPPPPQQSTTDRDHLANYTTAAAAAAAANGQQLLQEDGYSSTASSTSADHHNWSTAINTCSGTTGGQHAGGDDLFLQDLGFGSYTHEFLAAHAGFGDQLMVNAPLIYSSPSSSTKPLQGIIYQNHHLTNYYYS